MNANALKGKSKKGRKTQTGKLPNSFGMPSGKVSGGGVIRKLTVAETQAQREAGAFVVVNGKPFNGNFHD